MDVYTYVCIYVCMYVCIYVCMYLFMYLCIYDISCGIILYIIRISFNINHRMLLSRNIRFSLPVSLTEILFIYNFAIKPCHL